MAVGILSDEIEIVQNPVLGAAIIWNFVKGYYSNKCTFPEFQLVFIVLPIIYREELVELITSTNKPSGLRYFTDKLSTTKILQRDMLLHIHDNASKMKGLTLRSINIAISASLINIDTESCEIIPISTTQHKGVSKSIIQLLKAAEKLGFWCADLTLHEITKILKVRF